VRTEKAEQWVDFGGHCFFWVLLLGLAAAVLFFLKIVF
jgi:hypothetical protein